VPCSLEIRSTQLAPVHRVGNARHLKSRYPFVHLCPPYDNSSVHLTTTTEVRRSGRTTDGMRSSWRALRDSVLLSLTSAPTLPELALSRTAWVRLKRHLCTGFGRCRSSLHKWGMALSAACECGAEEQTFDQVVLHCTIHQPPHGAQCATWGHCLQT